MRPRIPDWLEVLELEDYLLLGATLDLPWAFGGVSVWAHRTAALLLVASAAVLLVRHGPAGLVPPGRSRWLVPAALLGLWAAIQLVPLPPTLIGWISPQARAIHVRTFPDAAGAGGGDTVAAIEAAALARAGEFEGLPAPQRPDDGFEPTVDGRWSGWRPLSLLPRAGSERLHWYFALLCAFLVARRRCSDAERADAYRGVLFVMFAALAAFGLVYAATSNGKLYWIRATIEPSRPFGPYVNPTNFAGVMELATPWIAGSALAAFLSGRARWREHQGPAFALLAALCLVAALATGSKAAAPLLGAGLIALGLLAVRGARARLAFAAAALLLALGLAVGLRHTTLGERATAFIDSTAGRVSGVDRVVAWRSAARMLGDFPITGSGFGSFRDVFPAYLPPGEQMRWEQLHNDYFEVAVEGGLVAALLLVWLAWAYWSRVGVLFRRIGPGGSGLGAVGLLVGLLSLSAHALVDFNHQIPADALVFVVLAGVAAARAGALREPGERAT